jgi:hypothetical protein
VSNQDANLNDMFSPAEQEAMRSAGVMGYFNAQWRELQAVIAKLNEHPETVTAEHVRTVRETIGMLMEWLRANGIDAHFDVTEASGLDVRAGDRL